MTADLICEQLVEEWTQQLERKSGQGTSERLLRMASDSDTLRDWTDEIANSTSDVYPYEVNFKDIKPKRVLRREVLQPGWTLGGQVAASTTTTFAAPQAFAGSPVLQPSVLSYHVAVDGKQTGPHGVEKLQDLVNTGLLKQETKVWKKGMSGWVPANQVDELVGLFVQPPPLDDEPPPID